MPDSDPSNRTPDSGPDRSGGQPPRKGPEGSPVPNRPPRPFLSLVLLFALFALVWFVVVGPQSKGTEIQLDEFRNLYANHLIDPDSVKVSSDGISAIREPEVSRSDSKGAKDANRPTTVRVTIAEGAVPYTLDRLKDWNIPFEMEKSDPTFLLLLINFGPIILVIFLVWFFVFRSMRNAGGGPGGMLGNFGKSRHRVQTADSVNVTFKDVAGVDEAKEEVTELVAFLKNPRKFQRLGGRIPRGVLLEGPPGCGKTLLAKAIAGEADVPFFTISGSDFVEMFVGVGASRVRDLFKQAKDNSPCIIFLDEIDAVGRRRGGGFTTGGHDEREQTLNAILVEMDGFEATDQVIVIAATNRVDVLDPALTRPGRFDRTVAVQLPDIEGRAQILAVHVKKVKTGDDLDLERLARATPGFSGADLAALINEAAIIATMADKDVVEMADFEEARDKVRWGRARRSRKVEEEDRVATAYHEAGHAVLQHMLEDADPLHKVTILPRGRAAGVSFSLPEKERQGHGLKFLEATLKVACGGRIAEEMKTGDISNGAASDIRMVSRWARAMVTEWGMSPRVGFVSHAHEENESPFAERDYSEETSRVIDEEVKRIVDSAYDGATKLLNQHWDQVVAVAEALLRHETLLADDVDKLMKGQRLSKPTVADLLAAEADKTPPRTATPPPSDETGEDLGGMMPSPA
jgi:cell division protease FtsH